MKIPTNTEGLANRCKRFASKIHWIGCCLSSFLVAALAIGCSREPSKETSRNNAPSVVASFFPLYDLARQIAGTNLQVTCLVPPGGDPHHEEPTPAMAREVAQANLVLLLGLGMDGWVEKLARAEKKPKSVVVSSGLAQRKMGITALANHSEEPSDPNEIDPHVWMDPLLAVRLAETIGRELALLARSSAESNALHQRTQAVIADLQRLHQEFESQLQDVPRRQVVTFHGAYGYLFDRYHLETAGVIETFPGTEPSAAYLKDLVKLMRQTGLKTIFAEPQLPDRPAQVIAQEIGGTVERLDPCETILPEASQWSYQQRQRQNLATLKRVLSTPNSR